MNVQINNSIVHQFGDLLNKPLGYLELYYDKITKTFHTILPSEPIPRKCISALPQVIKEINKHVTKGNLLKLTPLQLFILLENLENLQERILKFNRETPATCSCSDPCNKLRLEPVLELGKLFSNLHVNIHVLYEITELAARGFHLLKSATIDRRSHISIGPENHPYGQPSLVIFDNSPAVDKYNRQVLTVVQKTVDLACQNEGENKRRRDEGENKQQDEIYTKCFKILARFSASQIHIEVVEKCLVQPLSNKTVTHLMQHVIKFPEILEAEGNHCLLNKLAAAYTDFETLHNFLMTVGHKKGESFEELGETMQDCIDYSTAFQLLKLIAKGPRVPVSGPKLPECLALWLNPALAGIVADYNAAIDPVVQNLFKIVFSDPPAQFMGDCFELAAEFFRNQIVKPIDKDAFIQFFLLDGINCLEFWARLQTDTPLDVLHDLPAFHFAMQVQEYIDLNQFKVNLPELRKLAEKAKKNRLALAIEEACKKGSVEELQQLLHQNPHYVLREHYVRGFDINSPIGLLLNQARERALKLAKENLDAAVKDVVEKCFQSSEHIPKLEKLLIANPNYKPPMSLVQSALDKQSPAALVLYSALVARS